MRERLEEPDFAAGGRRHDLPAGNPDRRAGARGGGIAAAWSARQDCHRRSQRGPHRRHCRRDAQGCRRRARSSSAIPSGAPTTASAPRDVKAKAAAAHRAGPCGHRLHRRDGRRAQGRAHARGSGAAARRVAARYARARPTPWSPTSRYGRSARGSTAVDCRHRRGARLPATRARASASPARGRAMRILYGGSVKPDNAAPIFAVADVDGGAGRRRESQGRRFPRHRRRLRGLTGPPEQA